MAKIYIAAKTVVKVSIGSPSGNSVAVFVHRGDVVPEGVSEAQLERLEKQGFIEPLELPEAEPEPEVLTRDEVAEVRRTIEAEAQKVVDAKTELEAARKQLEADREQLATDRTKFEAAQSEAAKTPAAAKATPAKTAQS